MKALKTTVNLKKGHSGLKPGNHISEKYCPQGSQSTILIILYYIIYDGLGCRLMFTCKFYQSYKA